MDEPMGLIAGGGALPRLEAEGMRAAGRRVVGVGFSGVYEDDLPGMCDGFSSAGVLRPGTWARRLRRAGVKEAVMVGTVSRGGGGKTGLIYGPMRWVRNVPDWTAIRVHLQRRKTDQRSQAVLATVADELARLGITLVDTTRYIPEHLAEAGVMTKRQPSAEQRADVEFGWPVLMQMNAIEVGQAIAVKSRDIVAVEAIEGTDRMIERAGALCGTGWTLLKGAPEDKDRRFDVPTVGVQTIERLKAAGAGCVALAAGTTILVDKPAVLAAADAAGISVVGV
ncbi:MAG: UDP-2,3-diacylglucosamine diphosphatase LpxI [Planctomycetota bacterium]